MLNKYTCVPVRIVYAMYLQEKKIAYGVNNKIIFVQNVEQLQSCNSIYKMDTLTQNTK